MIDLYNDYFFLAALSFYCLIFDGEAFELKDYSTIPKDFFIKSPSSALWDLIFLKFTSFKLMLR